MRIAMTCNGGGHLAEMKEIERALPDTVDRFYMTGIVPATQSLAHAYRYHKFMWNPFLWIGCYFWSRRILKRERPDLVVSTGAQQTLPTVLAAHHLKIPVFFVDCSAQVVRASWTGRLTYPVATRFFVQSRDLLRVYGERAEYQGSFIR